MKRLELHEMEDEEKDGGESYGANKLNKIFNKINKNQKQTD